MQNINKISLLLFLLGGQICSAGVLYQFDTSDLIGYGENGKLYGHYFDRFSKFTCEFYFKTIKKSTTQNVSNAKIIAFDTNQFETLTSKGEIDASINSWIIKTNFPSYGCENFTKSTFGKNKNNQFVFTISAKTPALGLFALTEGAHFYEKNDNQFSLKNIQDKTLISDDLVAVLSKFGDYSYVQHFPKNQIEKISFGWVKTSTIKNPWH